MTSSIERAHEEYAEYRSLPVEDRFVIALLLDMGLSPRDKPQDTLALMNRWNTAKSPLAIETMIILSIAERAAAYRQAFKPKASDPVFNFGANALGPMIDLGTQWRRLGQLENPLAFRFLMEKLFGVEAREFVPAAYVACALHPAFTSTPTQSISEIDLPDFMDDCGWERECLYFPKPSDWE